MEGAERMRDAAERSSGTAGGTFNYRFIPAVQYAKELVDSGELGGIRHVRGRYLQDWLVDPEAPWSWRLDREVAGSGALGDLGSHTFDLVRFLVGDRVGDVERVSGDLRTFVPERPTPDGSETKPVTVDDAFTAQASFASGTMAAVEASRSASGHKNDLSVEINGSEGSLRFSLERLNELEFRGADDRGYQTILVTEESDPYVDHWWPAGHVLGWEHTFVHANREFLTAVDRGEEHTPSFADGYRVQELLDAVARSDERGEWVDLR
jgi:predicted dehydrogenase